MTSNLDSARDTVDPLDIVVANLPLLMLVGGLSATLLDIAAVVGSLVLALGSLPVLLGSWLYFYHWGRVMTYYEGVEEDGGHDESG